MGNYEKIKIGTLCKSIVPGRNKPKVFDGDIPWINTPDITSRYIPSSLHETCVSREELKNCGGKTVPAGAVIMACVGDLGLVAIANKEIVINQQLHAFICPENVHNEYIAYALEMQKSQMYRLASLTTIPYLNKSNCESLMVPCPPYSTQKRIANALEQWDAAIEKTEALIDAKERQFRWLQNTLIRENSDKWPAKALSSLSQIKKGQQLNRDTLDESGDYPVWNGGITPSGYTDKSNTVANTITISEGGSCGFVNFCKEDFWLGGHCYAVEKLDAGLDPDFLFFCLKANERRIMRLRVGSCLPNIQKKDIEKLQIRFPSIDEQKSIANTLNTAQQEITLLKKLVDQYRAQKRGLMQKLLSGKWHIKNKEAA